MESPFAKAHFATAASRTAEYKLDISGRCVANSRTHKLKTGLTKKCARSLCPPLVHP